MKTMLEMIKAGKTKCKYPITEVNGMHIACNGNHPTHIHEEVIAFLSERDGGTYVTFSKDQVKRIYMSELPIFDENNRPLCAHKCNDPVNERCILRVDENGNHTCGSRTHLTITSLREAPYTEVNARAREIQLLYLKVASLQDRTAYHK